MWVGQRDNSAGLDCSATLGSSCVKASLDGMHANVIYARNVSGKSKDSNLDSLIPVAQELGGRGGGFMQATFDPAVLRHEAAPVDKAVFAV